MTKTQVDKLLIGAHTSAAGGAHNALLEGHAIGATTVQLFTANQKRWKAKALSEKGIALFKETLEKTGLQQIMSHASYLINLASPNPESQVKSLRAFKEEIQRCLDLEISYMNFHPGAALDDTCEAGMDRIVEGMLATSDMFEDDSTRLLLETTAGQGSSIGYRFEELAYIIEKTHKKIPVGVCIDTCHIFAAGYDIRTPAAWKKTLDEFDRIVGLQYLYAFHVNDSIKELASRKDRHAPLGEGEIGIECFKFLMQHKPLQKIPKYLETPGGPPLWDKEIWMLREFARKG